MHRFRPLHSTNATVRAQLFNNETIIEQQIGVGLYDGKDKDDRHSDGSLYLTTHRLIYIDSNDPHRHSCFLDLGLIRQTEYWVGFLKSSAKITLLLGDPISNSIEPGGSPNITPRVSSSLSSSLCPTDILSHPAASHWACEVCGFSNSPGPKCGLCGIPRQSTLIARSAPGSFRARRPSSHQSNPIQSRFQSISHLGSLPDHSRPISIGSSDETRPETFIKEISCPTCTFLNHPSMARCEMCDSLLGTLQPAELAVLATQTTIPSIDRPRDLQHSLATSPAPPASFPSNSYIRLSFRKGGEKNFYSALKQTLKTKAWANDLIPSVNSARLSTSGSNAETSANLPDESMDTAKAIGIDGILKNMDSKQQAHRSELMEGLRDLEALMSKAKEMVQIAQAINAKLTTLESSSAASGEAEPSEQSAALIRSSLVKLGLPAPAVTADMIASDKAYAEELAKELGGFITRSSAQQEAIMRDGPHGRKGIVSLDEIWCIWNRARGVSLVSPSDMLMACEHLPKYTEPSIKLQTFKSGLRVLHTPYFETIEFGKRVMKNIKQKERSTLEIARFENINIGLAKELIERLEEIGEEIEDQIKICRDFDLNSGIVKWYPNLIWNYQFPS